MARVRATTATAKPSTASGHSRNATCDIDPPKRTTTGERSERARSAQRRAVVHPYGEFMGTALRAPATVSSGRQVRSGGPVAFRRVEPLQPGDSERAARRAAFGSAAPSSANGWAPGRRWRASCAASAAPQKGRREAAPLLVFPSWGKDLQEGGYI